MRRVTRALLVAVLVVSVTACASGGSEPAPKQGPVPAGWKVEKDRDFTIAVPLDWRYKAATTSVGKVIVNFLSAKEVDGYPQGVVIGRTKDVRPQDLGPIIDAFHDLQGDRTFGTRRDVSVGGRTGVLLESTRRVADKPITLQAWNVFVLTPSSVSLNVELLAPQALFDKALFEQILGTLVLEKRSLLSP